MLCSLRIFKKYKYVREFFFLSIWAKVFKVLIFKVNGQIKILKKYFLTKWIIFESLESIH